MRGNEKDGKRGSNIEEKRGEEEVRRKRGRGKERGEGGKTKLQVRSHQVRLGHVSQVTRGRDGQGRS